MKYKVYGELLSSKSLSYSYNSMQIKVNVSQWVYWSFTNLYVYNFLYALSLNTFINSTIMYFHVCNFTILNCGIINTLISYPHGCFSWILFISACV